MARNMYGATSADFTLTAGGRIVPGATLTIWSARTGGTQITDLLDRDSAAATTVTSGADGSILYYGPNNDKTVHWADTGVGSRVAVRPVDITGDPPVLSIGTVGTGAAAANLTGTSEAPVLNLTLPTAGANGVNTAALQDGAVTTAKIADGAVTPAKLATTGRFTFPTGAANGYGFASGAVHLSGTGTPEGVITAAPGSTYLQTDSVTDVKGWIRWVKATGTGNTGWVAGPEADTGWRDMSAEITAPAGTTIGTLLVRRNGPIVSWFIKVACSAGARTDTLTGTIPASLRPYSAFGARCVADDGVSVPKSFGTLAGTISIRHEDSAALWGYLNLVYPTVAAWPTSLPGSAV